MSRNSRRWRPTVAVLPDGSRHQRVAAVDPWRSRLVVGSDAREVLGMSFATLAVISLVAIVGPLLAWPRRWHLPIILGELAAGIVLGATGSGHLQADNETFTFLADIGFALIMFVVGAQVPVRDHRLRGAGDRGASRRRRRLAVGAARAGRREDLRHRSRPLVCGADGLVIGRVDLADRRFVGSRRKAGAADAGPGGRRRRRLHRGAAVGHRSQPCRTRGPRRAGGAGLRGRGCS
jgi:hypothetical protein